VVGEIIAEGDGTYYAAESCRSGSATVAFAITDGEGNRLYFSEAATPLTTLLTGPGSPLTVTTDDPQTSVTVEGGTGIYQGATGRGSCHSHSEAEFTEGSTSFTAAWTYDCALDIRTGVPQERGETNRSNLRYSHAGRSVGTIEGDCITSNVRARGDYHGEATGDLAGIIEGGGEGDFYAATQCQSGDLLTTLTLTDPKGDKLFITQTFTGTAETGFAASGDTITVTANLPHTVETITGGTGAYEGASGEGSCVVRTTGEVTPGTIDYESFWQSDCTMTMTLPSED
jgi:hypothetical protein